MHDHRSHGRDSERPDSDVRKEATTAEQDEMVELAVLAVVFDRHPALLTLAELTRQVADEPEEFMQGDAVERAVRDLGGVGLLHRNGELIVPSQAALRFSKLINSGGRS